MQPNALKSALGAGLLSFPVTPFGPDGGFNPEAYGEHVAWLAGFERERAVRGRGNGRILLAGTRRDPDVVRAAKAAAGKNTHRRRLRLRHPHGG